MSHMGMGGMIKADEIKGKTHYISVYPTHDHAEIALGDVKLAIQVTNTEGETRMALLKYSKMTHTYAGFIVMPKGKEHEVRIRVNKSGCQDFALGTSEPFNCHKSLLWEGFVTPMLADRQAHLFPIICSENRELNGSVTPIS